MIHLDTNFLVRSLICDTPEQGMVDRWETGAVRLGVCAPAWAEFLCGPVSALEVAAATALIGPPVAFGGADAELAAELFNHGGRRRSSLVDCMSAAVALRHGAALATANRADFARFTAFGLRLTSG